MYNMLRSLISVSLILLPSLTFSQSTHITIEPTALNKINIFFSPQLYFNTSNVINDGSSPDVISAKNTLGMQLGAEYERLGRNNILWSAGLLFGTHTHQVDIRYRDLLFLDPNTPSLGDSHSWNYTTTLNYFAPRIMVGYRVELNPKNASALDVKLGLSSRLYLSGLYKFEGITASYISNDTLYSNVSVVDNVVSLGNTKGQGTGTLIGAPNIDAYVGIAKSRKTWFLKDLSIGLHITHALIKKSPSDEILNRTWNRGKVISVDRYISRDFSIGIKLAVGI